MLCQLMRDERGHLFRGAGRRAVGWDLGMGDVWGFGGGTAAGCVCVMCMHALVEGDVCFCCYYRRVSFTHLLYVSTAYA